jgi:kynureninase
MAGSNDANFRHMFRIPTKGDLRRKTISRSETNSKRDDDDEPSIYLCGNSLGLQPTLTQKYMQAYLETWATKGVFGHFKEVSDTNLAPWLHVDDDVVPDMARIVGAKESEVAVMQTLTANLHLMLASFYRPDKTRYKIVLEGKAFPSDHYAVESQIRHHNLSPEDTMVLIDPPNPTESPLLPIEHILATIDAHASSTAVLLLPGIQFYTGQLFDIQRITTHAHAKGILVGWDLAHAVGNVPIQLHEWNVDFAVWCSYKYLNCGPGAIGGCFVRDVHFQRPRFAGWWGSGKSSRFAMSNRFEPIDGAAGFQLSNPSVADMTAVRASLDIFKQTSMQALRERSLKLTGALEEGLNKSEASYCYSIITPQNTDERGAQLSVQLNPGLLEAVLQRLEEEGAVVDERKPDVIRVAPAPLYNTIEDVEAFVSIFGKACLDATANGKLARHSVMAEGGSQDKGWSEIK